MSTGEMLARDLARARGRTRRLVDFNDAGLRRQYHPPQTLRVQSYALRRQKDALLNADGWGVGFFDGATPRRWRSGTPLWGDASFDSVAPALCSHGMVAAVCSATVGMSIEASATAPAESVCNNAILAALICARGLDALGEVIVQVGSADPTACSAARSSCRPGDSRNREVKTA